MGTPKGQLMLSHQPLLSRHVEALSKVTQTIYIVVGPDTGNLPLDLRNRVTIVEAPDGAKAPMIGSIARALHVAPVGPTWITPVDTPPARVQTLDKLWKAGWPSVPVDAAGHRGHPVLIGPHEIAAIRASPPAGGLRALLTNATEVLVEDPLVAWDFDDPEAWGRFAARWRDA